MEKNYTSQSLGAIYDDVYGAHVLPDGQSFDKKSARYPQLVQNMLNQGMISYQEDGDRRVFDRYEAQKVVVLLLLADLRIDAAGRRAFADEYEKIPFYDADDKLIAANGFAHIFHDNQAGAYLFIEMHDAKISYTLSARKDYSLHDKMQARLVIPVSKLLYKLFSRDAEVRQILQRFGRM